VLFLLAVLLAMAGPRRAFARKLDTLLTTLGLPRRTFYRLTKEIKECGYMTWRPVRGLIEFTMMENPDRDAILNTIRAPSVEGVYNVPERHAVPKNSKSCCAKNDKSCCAKNSSGSS